MQKELRDACMRYGWDTLYRQLIPNLGPSNARGECRARSPFPFADDSNPSFTVNVENGLWRDYSTGYDGNYVMFVAFMNAPIDERTGKPTPNYGEAELQLKLAFGITQEIDTNWLAECRRLFVSNNGTIPNAWGSKPWNIETLQTLGVGWDERSQRFVLPIQDRYGKVVNCRMYRPDATPKILWHQPGAGGNFLFPYNGWTDPWVILVEGEADAISLRCLGYNAVSGTLGAKNPVPDGLWWRDKQVFILMDADAPGQEAAQFAEEIIRAEAAQVKVATLPNWPSRPHNADISDYIVYLRATGLDNATVCTTITDMLSNARVALARHHIYDSVPITTNIATALSSVNARVKLQVRAHVLAHNASRYSLPTRCRITCSGEGRSACSRCEMHNRWHGSAIISLDPRSENAQRYIQADTETRNRYIYDDNGIASRCDEPTLEVLDAVDVDMAVVGSCVEEAESHLTAPGEAIRHDAYILTSAATKLSDGIDYDFTGFVYPNNRTQRQIFWFDKYTPRKRQLDDFEMTPDTLRRLSVFWPTTWDFAGVKAKLLDVASDISNNVTNIYGRPDLHMLYRCVWHSLLSFPFNDTVVKRGWMEALVIGDTRCGKSVAFQRMAQYLQIGVLCDCKMQTAPGLLGAVEQSQATGERYVIAGLLPRQDGRIVCMDEFTAPRWARMGIMDQLSSTRAEGIVRITKAAHATFPARVRMIWLANPGVGKLLRDIGRFGVEIVSNIIDQPEDIARFDAAMAVASEDVPLDVINSLHKTTQPKYSAGISQELIAWAWSRTIEDVVWSADTQQLVIDVAKRMIATYDSAIPLVEPSDQRTRVAKLAISVAAQMFSTDDTGTKLVVRPEHVEAAEWLFTLWYTKPSFAYDVFSETSQRNKTLEDEAAVQGVLTQAFGTYTLRFAEQILRLQTFTERQMLSLVPMQPMSVSSCLQQLSALKCIVPHSSKSRDMFVLTPPFVAFLRRYIETTKYEEAQ